jgi:predicted NBD/HSP70 family sugar kinase
LSYKTPSVSTEILSQILEGIEILKKEFDIKAIGIATAGAVNKENTRVVGSTGNLPKGYSDINFKEEIENKLNSMAMVNESRIESGDY